MNAPSPIRPRVSLCLIAKNEEAHLPACLGSAADLVDEIVLVDTGSTDATRDIARQFGAKVVDFPWIDDFSAARNECLRHATGRWIFWMDADDSFDEANRQKLRTLLAGLGEDSVVFLMHVHCLLDEGTRAVGIVEHPRLFRNQPGVGWRYPVHEQVLPSLVRAGAKLVRSDVVVQHRSYASPEQLDRKVERNFRILERAYASDPDDPFILFYLGWTSQHLGRDADSLAYLRRSLELGAADSLTAPKAYALLVQAQRRLKQSDSARLTCTEGLARYLDDAELLNQDALLRHEIGDLPGAEARLRRLIELSGKQSYPAMGVDPSIWGYKARYKLGVICNSLDRKKEAEEFFLAVLDERADLADVWIELANLWIFSMEFAKLERAVARLEADPRRCHEALILRSVALSFDERFGEIRRLLGPQLGVHPRSTWLRILFVEAALNERKELKAAEQALHEVLQIDPRHPEALEYLDEVRREQRIEKTIKRRKRK